MRIEWIHGIGAELLTDDGYALALGLSSHEVTEALPPIGGSGSLLEIRQLSHWFGASRARAQPKAPPVLEDINLHVAAGEIVVLLGPSGCGKSTLLNLASGLAQRQRGSVRLLGTEISSPDSRLGLVFQQPALLPWLTVRGNVEFGLTLRHSEPLSARQRNERIQQALQLVGLSNQTDVDPSHLSGGMAQRVALARVLVRNPKLLLLDEPFSALDAITRAEMQTLLLRITQETGAGVLIVTHDVDEAMQLGDRILLMRSAPGSIEREWKGCREADAHAQQTMRGEILRHLGKILQSRSP